MHCRAITVGDCLTSVARYEYSWAIRVKQSPPPPNRERVLRSCTYVQQAHQHEYSPLNMPQRRTPDVLGVPRQITYQTPHLTYNNETRKTIRKLEPQSQYSIIWGGEPSGVSLPKYVTIRADICILGDEIGICITHQSDQP